MLGAAVPVVDTKSYYYIAGRRVALRDSQGVRWLHAAPQGFAAMMTDSAGKVVAQQRYTPLGKVRLSGNAYGTSYSLSQTKLKAGKAAPNPSLY